MDQDVARRRRAVASLDPEREPWALLEGLDDPAWQVRHEAVRHLRAMRAPEPLLEALLERVVGESIEARCAALEVLRSLGAVVQAPVLARLASGAAPVHARRFLVEALLEGADAGCVGALEPLLHDPDPTLAPVALEVLGTLEDPRARSLVRSSLDHPDPVARITALLALQRRPREAPVDALVALALEPLTAEPACALLVAHGSPEALGGVVRALLGPSPLASSAALGALAPALPELARGGLPEGLKAPLGAALGVAEDVLRGALEGPSREVAAVLLVLLGGASAPEGARSLLAASPGSRWTMVEGMVSSALLAHPSWLEALVGEGGSVAEGALAFLWRRGPAEPGAWVSALVERAVDRGVGGVWPWALLLRTEAGLRRAVERLPRALELLDDVAWDFLLASDAPVPWLQAVLVSEGSGPLGMRAAEQLAAKGCDVDRALLAEGEARGGRSREAALGARLYLGACTFEELVAWTQEPSEALAEAAAFVLAQREDIAERLEASFDALPLQTRCRLLRVSSVLEAHGRLCARALDAAEPELVREAVSQLPDDAPLSTLERLVEHRDPSVACEALARMLVADPSEARARGRALLRAPAPELRREALRALDPRSPEDRGLALEALHLERESSVRDALEAWLEPFFGGRKTL